MRTSAWPHCLLAAEGRTSLAQAPAIGEGRQDSPECGPSGAGRAAIASFLLAHGIGTPNTTTADNRSTISLADRDRVRSPTPDRAWCEHPEAGTSSNPARLHAHGIPTTRTAPGKIAGGKQDAADGARDCRCSLFAHHPCDPRSQSDQQREQ